VDRRSGKTDRKRIIDKRTDETSAPAASHPQIATLNTLIESI
jgi:hypothetical protein